MTAEEEVRAAWKTVRNDGSKRHPIPVICREVFDVPFAEWDSGWQAALDFTRKRQEEIRQINEEIGCIVPERQHFADNAWSHHHAGRYYEVAISVKWEVRFARILSRLTAQRDELRKGMRA